MRRLGSVTVLYGFLAAWLRAASPTRRPPSVYATMEGVVRLPASLSKMRTSLPCHTPTQLQGGREAGGGCGGRPRGGGRARSKARTAEGAGQAAVKQAASAIRQRKPPHAFWEGLQPSPKRRAQVDPHSWHFGWIRSSQRSQRAAERMRQPRSEGGKARPNCTATAVRGAVGGSHLNLLNLSEQHRPGFTSLFTHSMNLYTNWGSNWEAEKQEEYKQEGYTGQYRVRGFLAGRGRFSWAGRWARPRDNPASNRACIEVRLPPSAAAAAAAGYPPRLAARSSGPTAVGMRSRAPPPTMSVTCQRTPSTERCSLRLSSSASRSSGWRRRCSRDRISWRPAAGQAHARGAEWGVKRLRAL